MFPILIDFGSHELPLLGRTHLFLPTYGAVFAGATVLAWWWFLRRGRTLGIAEDRLFSLSFYTLVAGIVGAKLTLVAVDWRMYLEHPVALAGTLRAAGVLMGGIIAGGLMFAAYARRAGLPFLRLADAIAAPLALAQGLGRFGCFLAGCCWGVRASQHTPFALTFTDAAAHRQTGVELHVPLVPTQLYQMTNDLLLAALLTWLWKRRPEPAGTIAWLYVLLYCVGRGVIEFWRGDRDRGLYFGEVVSTSQLLSLAGVALALAMLLRGRRALRGGGALAAAARARR